MCVIIDVNAIDKIFGKSTTPAGDKLREWISGSKRLVVGGRLREELQKSSRFTAAFEELNDAGKIIPISDERVADALNNLVKHNIRSNDVHVIALAQASQARLLCTFDKDLIKDFKNKDHINQPRGKVYSLATDKFTRSHRNLLNSRDLCASTSAR